MGILGYIKDFVETVATSKGGKKRKPPKRMTYTEDNPGQLWETVWWTFREMENIRTGHAELVREFCGDRYGTNRREIGHDVISNKINQMVLTYLHLMTSGDPQTLVETPYPQFKPFAKTLELGLNRLFSDINIRESLALCVTNAMFSFGVAKTGLAEGDEFINIDGNLYDPMQPFTSSVCIDNFVVDIQAESEEAIEFIGDRYLRPLSWVNEIRKASKRDAMGDGLAEKKTESQPYQRVSGVEEHPDKRLVKKVWVWDIFLPKQGYIMTYVEGDPQPLVTWEWDGPSKGPYEILQFQRVPGEVLGVSPVQTVYHLHQAQNNLLRKIYNQAEREKKLLLCSKGDHDDMDIIRKANDGDAVALMDPQATVERIYGGPDMQLHNLAMQTEAAFDTMAGNLGVLGGLQAQSETFRQDKMLSDAANVRISAMGNEVMRFMEKVFSRHAWYLWSMQLEEVKVMKPVKGTDIVVPATLTPEERDGKFLDYNFKINPYSMKSETPSEKLQKLLSLWESFVMASVDIAQQSNYKINFEKISTQISEYAGIDLDTLYQAMDPAEAQEQMAQGAQQAPPRFKMSKTQNERISKPGTTEAGNRNQFLQANAASIKQQGQPN